MEELWTIIAPYVAAISGTLGSGVLFFIINRFLTSRLLKKVTATINIDNLAQRVAEKLVGKTLNIDVTALTDKALKKLAEQIDKRLTKQESITDSYKLVLALMARVLSRLKANTPEETKALEAAAKDLECDFKPKEAEEVMTVVLKPIAPSRDEYKDSIIA